MRSTCMLGGWARRARDDGSGWLKAHSAVPGGNRQARLPARPRASHPRHLTATRAGRQSRERDASAPGPVSRELGVAEEIEVAEAPNSLRCYARGCPAGGDRPVSVGAPDVRTTIGHGDTSPRRSRRLPLAERRSGCPPSAAEYGCTGVSRTRLFLFLHRSRAGICAWYDTANGIRVHAVYR